MVVTATVLDWNSGNPVSGSGESAQVSFRFLRLADQLSTVVQCCSPSHAGAGNSTPLLGGKALPAGDSALGRRRVGKPG